ncbi:DUF1572 family protein [Bacillus sp. P14.5]|uniref:DUF1572 family protein n=1 Tax=Bacillus sp. P14.5 TaxID=1983400 RepID=UPI000DEBE277|nr:DUF1572 family protein [Bacillus sp. P14.5]
MTTLEKEYLNIVKLQFQQMKNRAEKAIEQLSDAELHKKHSTKSNDIAIIMRHISGNMSSRWVDFLERNGGKSGFGIFPKATMYAKIAF